MPVRIIDLFAGPGGWDEGLRLLGRRDVLGIEWDAAACETAEANGHARLRADIATLDPHDVTELYLSECEGLIASPPCQAWSLAGKRGGEHDRAACHTLADRMALLGDDSIGWTDWADERSALVCQPVRWVRELSPEWVALEEVPAVRGLWEHFADIFRGWGYSVWTGVLQAEAYGVPQTRKRAILIASRTREVVEPPRTHSRYYPRTPDKLDAGVLPWVSMAEALGSWGWTQRPSFTVCGNPWWASRTQWRDMRQADDEARGGEGWEAEVLRMSNQANAAARNVAQPAPTLAFANGLGARWIPRGVDPQRGAKMNTEVAVRNGALKLRAHEAAVLQTFPADYYWHGKETAQFVQIGNAVPPLLAAHVLRAVGVE